MKFLSKLPYIITLTLIPTLSYATENDDIVIINTADKEITLHRDDAEQYLLENNLDYQELLFPLNNKKKTQTLSSNSTDWHQHIKMIQQGSNVSFINFTSECRWAIFNVSNTKGYNQIFSHKATPYDAFGYPPYKKKGGTYTRSILSTLSCNAKAPGIIY